MSGEGTPYHHQRIAEIREAHRRGEYEWPITECVGPLVRALEEAEGERERLWALLTEVLGWLDESDRSDYFLAKRIRAVMGERP